MTLHDCPPPQEALERWLIKYPSTVENYGHLLLEQDCDTDEELIQSLVSYFESAHKDARAVIHSQMGMDLHPDAEGLGAHAVYPSCLPPTARRGLFGEVMVGMLTEHYDFIGNHNWDIPVFLFRFDTDATAYLFALARDDERKRAVFGRSGSDFLAVALNTDGEVIRYISGEAKWRKNLQPAVVDNLMYGDKKKNKKTGELQHNGKGIWNQVNTDVHPPHGLRQLQIILKDVDPEGHSAAIASLDKVLTLGNADPLPCTNLILLSGGDVPSREKKASLLPWEEVPEKYTSTHDLQVVELILTDGEKVIDGVYDALWSD